MDKIFWKMPCLSESPHISAKVIYEKLFDKNNKVDRRFIETDVQKFLLMNKKVFEFAGVTVRTSGAGNTFTMQFITSNYIGAIPIKMPYDGIVHKDFQIVPRFDEPEDVYAVLAKILDKMDYSIQPEYEMNSKLALPYQLRMPLYNEAIKYLDLFNVALKYKWQKFDSIEKELNYPSNGTDWIKYACKEYMPQRMFIYPTKKNYLSLNHKEWQELVYVLELSNAILNHPTVPGEIRYKYQVFSNSLCRRVKEIDKRKANEIHINNADPACIKELKKQANLLLQKETATCTAWRMDMAELFERYSQYVLAQAVSELSGTLRSNPKITCRGNIPKWGLKYLEPDMAAVLDSKVLFADAKYKVHMYMINSDSITLKETFRHDLHQVLAYCSFEKTDSKTCMIFYPSGVFFTKDIVFEANLTGTQNKVILCGIPFGDKIMLSNIDKLKNVIKELII